MHNASSSLRRRTTTAITAATAIAAMFLTALVVAAHTPADAAQASRQSPAATPWQAAHLRSADPTLTASRRSQAPADPNGAFLYNNGRFTPLGGVPGAAAAGHVDVNNRGQTVGFYADAQGVIRSFVKDQRGRVTTFAVPGAQATLAVGVNDRGQVAGTSFDPGCAIEGAVTPCPPGTAHGFIRQPNGRITTIDLPRFANAGVTDINNRGQVVGQTADASGQLVGFVRDLGGRITIIRLPGSAAVGEVLALNDRGQVVGEWDDRVETLAKEPNTRHGFVWDRGSLTRFDIPGSLATGALGINNAGQITGAYDDVAGRHHGFVRQPGGRITTIDAPGRRVTDAWGINDRGQIVIPDLGTGLTPLTEANQPMTS